MRVDVVKKLHNLLSAAVSVKTEMIYHLKKGHNATFDSTFTPVYSLRYQGLYYNDAYVLLRTAISDHISE